VPEATLAKRLTRAKQKIVAAGIPYRAPEPEERRERLDQVLRVIYLVFNEAYLTTSGDNASRWELAHDAGWLATLLIRWLPDEPEPLGLLALIRLHLARWPARVDDEGGLVLLKDQNRLAWDRGQIDDAVSLIARAAAMGRPGPYQVEAAMQAVHCEASTWEDTDWPQLLQLYSLLASMDRTPVVLLNRAVVVAEVEGPGAALEQVEVLARPLARYHLYHATRADLLRRLGRDVEACVADREALRLTTNPAERAVLLDRIGRGTRAAGRDDAG